MRSDTLQIWIDPERARALREEAARTRLGFGELLASAIRCEVEERRSGHRPAPLLRRRGEGERVEVGARPLRDLRGVLGAWECLDAQDAEESPAA